MSATDHPLRSEVMTSVDNLNAGAMSWEQFAPDVVFTVPGHSEVSGVYRGREGVGELFGRFHSLSGGTFTVEPREVLANDDHLVVFLRFTGQRDDDELDVAIAGFHRDRGPDGWRRATFLPDDLTAFDRFFAAR